MCIKKTRNDIAIVGGGAAGMLAACVAAQNGACVTLYESNKNLGRKLAITGKGRCNLTNNCDVQEFISNVPTGAKFLYSALYGFTPQDTMAYFESLGVPLKTERGNRVFPVSDKAYDVVDALKSKLRELGVKTVYSRVDGITAENGKITGISVGGKHIEYSTVILATGGRSYPLTGSTGDGYVFARSLGHTITDIKPSLVPLVTVGDTAKKLMGLSLKNVSLKVRDTKNGKIVYEDFGEMLFTHFGVSGPLILSASAHMRNMNEGRYELHFDLKPALSEAELDKRILSDFEKYKNKDFVNSLSDLLPLKLIPVFCELCGIPERIKVNSIDKISRQKMVSVLKDMCFAVKCPRPIEEAIITSGGIKLSEIDSSTMESKLCKGLYFAGEIIDVDAYTGGFNLQIAFSTAYLAAVSAVNNKGDYDE